MLHGRLKLQFAAFFLLSGGLAANLLLLQPLLREQSAQRSGAQGDTWLADAQIAGFGDTGSITRSDAEATKRQCARGFQQTRSKRHAGCRCNRGDARGAARA